VPGEIVRTSFFGFVPQQIKKYWPQVLELYPQIGRRNLEPVFLSFEASQYLMGECIDKKREEMDFFAGASVSTDRIAIELTATLSRAALAGISYEDIGSRLEQGSPSDTLFEQGIYDEIDVV